MCSKDMVKIGPYRNFSELDKEENQTTFICSFFDEVSLVFMVKLLQDINNKEDTEIFVNNFTTRILFLVPHNP
jgi:hypothetical protein